MRAYFNKPLLFTQVPLSAVNDKGDQNFKRKLSKREKKELKKKEKLSRLKSDTNDENRPVAEKLYTGNLVQLVCLEIWRYLLVGG